LHCMEEVREITLTDPICARSVISASVMPSEKYSCAASPVRFCNGKTANACPKHFGFLPNLQPRESEIVDAVFQSEKSIRGEPVESCKLRYSNSFEFFDHTTCSL
jgi:hypothetical protein